MNSPDPLVDLLHAADDAAPRPQLAPDLAAAIHRRARQRSSRRNRLVAASTLIAVVAVISGSVLRLSTLSPRGRGQARPELTGGEPVEPVDGGEGDAGNSTLASSQPTAAGLLPAADLARLKSEAAALKSQADALQRQVDLVRSEQHRQNLRDECRSQFAQAAADDIAPSPQDQAALIALGQGDYYWQTRREEKPAEAAYQSILENYPGSRWAAVAKERLQQFQMN